MRTPPPPQRRRGETSPRDKDEPAGCASSVTRACQIVVMRATANGNSNAAPYMKRKITATNVGPTGTMNDDTMSREEYSESPSLSWPEAVVIICNARVDDFQACSRPRWW